MYENSDIIAQLDGDISKMLKLNQELERFVEIFGKFSRAVENTRNRYQLAGVDADKNSKESLGN